MVHTDWEGLIAEHDHTVVLSLLSRGFRIQEAREIAHDTWTRLFEQQQAGRLTTMELPGLAIRQAMFLAADYRRSRRRPVVPVESVELVDPELAPDARAELRQIISRTEEAAERLSPRAKVVFTAVVAEAGTPHAVLAQRLGISLQRLRQSLCEVRMRLKASLEEAR